MKRTLVLGLVAAAFLGVFVNPWNSDPVSAETSLDPPLALSVSQGADLYQQYCAACHGANLEGQGDWRAPGEDGRLPAPPHDETGHTWHHGDELLFAYTKLGGKELMAARGMDFDSGMPGFQDVLSDAEIWAILDYIKSTWPERVQDIQAQRSVAEQSVEDN